MNGKLRRMLVLGVILTASGGPFRDGGSVTRAQYIAQTPNPTPNRLDRFEFRERLLGTEVRLVFYMTNPLAAAAAAEAAFDRVRQLDRVLSSYRSDSEISRLCRSFDDADSLPAARSVSDDLWAVLLTAREVHVRSHGAFDVTVAPLTRLWKRAIRRGELPGEERLAAARGLVGLNHVVLSNTDRSVRFTKPGIRMDMGGIGKGYIADEVLRLLEIRGATRALVDAGGDVACGDPPPGESGWRIVVDVGPTQGEGDAQTPSERVVLQIANRAVATSGDAYQSAMIGKRHVTHFVDPRTGETISRPPTATVIAPDATHADAWASALCILDIHEGTSLITALPHTEARWMLANPGIKQRDGPDREGVLESRGFAAFLESGQRGSKP